MRPTTLLGPVGVALLPGFGCIWEPDPPERTREPTDDAPPIDTAVEPTDTGTRNGKIEVLNETDLCIVGFVSCDQEYCTVGYAREPYCKISPHEVLLWGAEPGRIQLIAWGPPPDYLCATDSFLIRAGETTQWTISELYDCGIPPMF